MDREHIGAIRARLDLATDGPWKDVVFGPTEPITIIAELELDHPTPLARVLVGQYRAEAAAMSGRFVGTAEDDARFLVNSKADIAFLLAELQANDALLTAAEKRLAKAEAAHSDFQRTAFFAALILAGLTLVGGVLLGMVI